MAENPTTEGFQVQRHGKETPNPLRPFNRSPEILAIQSAPAKVEECVYVGRHVEAEFIVVPAPGITVYDITFGRWVASKNTSDPKKLDHWLELGTVTITVASQAIGRVQFATNTDAVAAYISDETGTATTPGYLFFYRGAGV
jgi:hypothetical protein